ncbi:MAG: hypothetical protein KJ063_09165 [Anaerolineae bacterium]|nr:hypothetical protein [Anaerolineae bacterium]
MSLSGKWWTVYDRDGNPIYLTHERWSHIVDLDNHSEMMAYKNQLKSVIRKGHRQQEPLNPRKYRYTLAFDDLPDDFAHIVAIVLFGFDVDPVGHTIPNNFVATAFMKTITAKGIKR